MAASAAKIPRQIAKLRNCEIAMFLAKPRFAKPMLVSARTVRTFEKAWPSKGETITRDKPFLRISSSRAPSWHTNDSLSRFTVLIGTIQPTPRKKVVRGIASDGLEYRPQVERVSDGRCSQQHSILLLIILYKSAKRKKKQDSICRERSTSIRSDRFGLSWKLPDRGVRTTRRNSIKQMLDIRRDSCF